MPRISSGVISYPAVRQPTFGSQREKTSAERHPASLSNLSPDPAVLDAVPDRDALYKEFAPLVRRLIRQYGENPAMREDLQGEIYCRFCALLEQYDPHRGVPLRAYLVRQLSASIYLFARRHWVRQRRELLIEPDLHLDLPMSSQDPTPLWDQELMHKQFSVELHHAMSRLSERQRRIIEWRYYEQRSSEEIGALLNVQPATARSLLRHAINTLRKRMAPPDQPRPSPPK